ncbi:hypothetical protein CEW91_06315 [Idiomarina piscisalsi]|uniref:YiaAB two helix domain-containing protein n=1 Tax=Idiomarina piscisalsi TaxID=1096243 RepID=A0ABM6LTF1_9GAMM|nr:hypothetical protein [Idiomarina piscisalsi]ASG65776.1 hypothetical protein CEW91_06315 [Idiomarina piscisalsi]
MGAKTVKNISFASALWTAIFTVVIAIAIYLNDFAGTVLGFGIVLYKVNKINFLQLVNAEETNQALNELASRKDRN